MKKKLLFVFMMIICLCLVSACSKTSSVSYADEYKEIYAAHKQITKSVNRNVVNEVKLPTAVEGTEITVTWESKNQNVISNSGVVIDRPSSVTKVDFDYTLTNANVSKTYTLTINVSPLTLSDVEKEILNNIPEETNEDVELTDNYANGIIQVIYTSSNPEYLDEDGTFNYPASKKDVTISYVISDGNEELKGNTTITVLPKELDVRFSETEEWLNLEAVNDLYLTEKTKLPSEYEKTGATIYWSSSIDGILNSDNTITQYVYERYTTLTAAVSIDGQFNRYRFYVSVKPLDTTNMSKEEIVANFVKGIAVNTYSRMVYNQDGYIANTDLEAYGYTNVDTTWGFINYYDGSSSSSIMKENIAPLDSESGHDNRPGTLKPSIEYICVHDTADPGALAQQEANYVASGGGGTSWHYTVDYQEIWHQIPDNEVAYHAGDGTRFFALIDTGIKATAVKPYISLDENGYYAINGVSTTVRPLTGSNAAGIYEEDPTIYTTDQLGHCKITCEIGENGNYYLGRSYYNSTYKLIANFGGNRNSIGIESSVASGKDYCMTTRNIAKLCSDLCIEYNLDVDRVVPHHYFSGKPCGNAFFMADKWHDFHDMVSLEVFGKTMLKDTTFTWTSLTSNIDANGSILKKSKVGDVVKYSVNVTDSTGKKLYEASFETTLK